MSVLDLRGSTHPNITLDFGFDDPRVNTSSLASGLLFTNNCNGIPAISDVSDCEVCGVTHRNRPTAGPDFGLVAFENRSSDQLQAMMRIGRIYEQCYEVLVVRIELRILRISIVG